MNRDEIDALESALYDEKSKLICENNRLLGQVAANDARIKLIRIQLGQINKLRDGIPDMKAEEMK